MGRPSEYTEETGLAICSLLADGQSLRQICEAEDMPSRATVFKWLSTYPLFADQYARAREEQADAIADEITWIADTEEDPQKARVRIDARKWVAGKMRPKKYGDKTVLSGDPENPVQFQRIERVIVDGNAKD